MEQVDVVVVGGGVTGLASARAIAARGLTTCLLERHPRPGLDTSTHNSGVIHAGIYHPPGSLKSTLCIEGRRLLYEFCARHNVPHVKCGKLIVAHDASEIAPLERLAALGLSNDVAGLTLVDRAFMTSKEPAVAGVAAIWSPESGVVDADALVKALLRTAQADGVIFLPGTRLLGASRDPSGMVLRTGRETIHARIVVNAAGLYADEVSAILGGEPFTIYPCRGEYAELTPAKRTLVRGLIYPLPHASGHGLGVHLVRATGGQVWLGPTIRYQERKDDYEDDREPLEHFAAAAQRMIAGVSIEDLRLAGSGIRAKLHPASEPYADFMIRRDRRNPLVVHAAGIDSPGLTSCLAVGGLVSRIVADSR